MAEFSRELDQYLELRRLGRRPISSARQVGLHHKDIERLARIDPAFGAALEDAEAEALERVEEAVFEAGQDGDLKAAQLILESHKAETWTKPAPDIILKVQQEPPDISELHARLKELAAIREAETNVIDVEPEDDETALGGTTDGA